MNRGLIAKTIREVWWLTLLFALGLAGVKAALSYILPSVDPELVDQWLKMRFVQDILTALLGTEVGEVVGPGGYIASIPWVHPIVLTLVWAHGIMCCTRVPAGEVDRGTIDVLLSLPVSRVRVYACESVVWLASGARVVTLGMVGHWVGARCAGSETAGTVAQLVMVNANLYCLYVAVGGIACVVSSLCDRRGRAIGIVFAIVVASFLLNFLAPFWGLAKSVSFLSVLDYYKPLFILRDTAWPVTDLGVLIGVGGVLWMVGALIIARRDICTV